MRQQKVKMKMPLCHFNQTRMGVILKDYKKSVVIGIHIQELHPIHYHVLKWPHYSSIVGQN